jgi:hypothetical protein
MSAESVSQLKKAADLIRKGKTDKAQALLVKYLRAEPNHAQAWYLLSYTLADPQKKQYALQQALRADPQFERAQQRLLTLRGQAAQGPKVEPRPLSKPAAIPVPPKPLISSPVPKPEAAIIEPERVFRDESAAEGNASGPGPRRILVIMGLIVLFAVVFVLSRDWFAALLAGSAAEKTPVALASRTQAATWTPSAPTPGTPQSNAQQTAQAALQLPPLDPQVEAQMAAVQEQVSQLRGLPLNAAVEKGIVPADRDATILSALYLGTDTNQDLENSARVLVAMGLLPDDYVLTDYQLSNHADRFGGIYVPKLRRIYLFGTDFSGLLPYVYARESDLAIIDENFKLENMLGPGLCLPFSDSCRALKAFIEGDVDQLSQQWLNSGAPAATFQQVQAADPSAMLLESRPAAQFTLKDLSFLYQQGTNFVQTVFEVGGWDQIDTVYSNPPGNTEQIMHPEKYFAGETGQSLVDPLVSDGLGAGWTSIGDGNLGEWLTYLLLAQGENLSARLPEEQARLAAAGWGGDQFQAYNRQADGALALAEHWIMDSDVDAGQLADALQTYFGLRFGVAPSEMGSGKCWSASGQSSCLFFTGAEVLWLLGPDEPQVLQAMLSQFPKFQ